MAASPVVQPAPTPLAAWTARLLEQLPAPQGPLAVVQERGRRALASLPVPSRREESWRFTDLAPLVALPLAASGGGSGAVALPPPAAGALRLILDGDQDPLAAASLPPGLSRLEGAELAQALGHTLATADCEHQWPVELNHACAPRVLALRVASRAEVSLELVSQATTGLQPLRVLLLLEEKAQLHLSQWLGAAGASLTSLVLEAHLGRSAQLHHGVVAFGHPQAALLAHLVIEQEPESRATLVSASAGWALARWEPRIRQVDGQAHTTLRGLQVVDGHQVADTHSHLLFSGRDGQLDQLHKAVAAGSGRSVFNGAVRVPREAQGTDAAQLSRNLLLSDRARIDTKPELEIVADDVSCAHGATVSSLETDQLFYLQSRGIGAEQAATLLRRGFCEDVLQQLPAAARAWAPFDRLQQAAAGEVRP